METFENIRKYSNFFYPPAHLIDFFVSHEKAQKTQRKINHEWTRIGTKKLTTDFTDFAEKYGGYKYFPLTKLVGKMD